MRDRPRFPAPAAGMEQGADEMVAEPVLLCTSIWLYGAVRGKRFVTTDVQESCT
jgi:hypothetical protein